MKCHWRQNINKRHAAHREAGSASTSQSGATLQVPLIADLMLRVSKGVIQLYVRFWGNGGTSIFVAVSANDL
jgi:hypothetical protein